MIKFTLTFDTQTPYVEIDPQVIRDACHYHLERMGDAELMTSMVIIDEVALIRAEIEALLDSEDVFISSEAGDILSCL